MYWVCGNLLLGYSASVITTEYLRNKYLCGVIFYIMFYSIFVELVNLLKDPISGSYISTHYCVIINLLAFVFMHMKCVGAVWLIGCNIQGLQAPMQPAVSAAVQSVPAVEQFSPSAPAFPLLSTTSQWSDNIAPVQPAFNKVPRLMHFIHCEHAFQCFCISGLSTVRSLCSALHYFLETLLPCVNALNFRKCLFILFEMSSARILHI